MSRLAPGVLLLALCGLLFFLTAAAPADEPLAVRRTPTPSDTPQPTATATPATSAVLVPSVPAATPTPKPADELVVLFNDLESLVISRYPDGSISFWRAHPDRGNWGFVAWLDITAQPGERGGLVVDAKDDGWHLVVQRIDDCGEPSPKRPADPAELHLYAARVVARTMCDGRPMYYLWLTDTAGVRVTEGAFAP